MADDSPLSPDPAAVVETLAGIAAGPWPTTEADRLAMFARVGFTDQEVTSGRPDSFPFGTSLADEVGGSWSTFDGEFLGFSLFCYYSADGSDPKARAGYDRLKMLLSAAYGPPVEAWGSEDMPACAWTINGLELSMNCHGGLNSCVQLGLEHAERTAANNAAHDAEWSRRPD